MATEAMDLPKKAIKSYPQPADLKTGKSQYNCR